MNTFRIQYHEAQDIQTGLNLYYNKKYQMGQQKGDIIPVIDAMFKNVLDSDFGFIQRFCITGNRATQVCSCMIASPKVEPISDCAQGEC